jgi:hypothetical protein
MAMNKNEILDSRLPTKEIIKAEPRLSRAGSVRTQPFDQLAARALVLCDYGFEIYDPIS